MLSTHLTSCPKFGALTPAERERTITSQGACLQCSAWDHKQYKLPGGGPAEDLRWTGECGQKHGPWFHLVAGGTANTGSIVGCGVTSPRPATGRLPGLYEVYAVDMESSLGHRQLETVLVDPGSDTNYVRHDYAKRLGVVGTPYTCYLKVVDVEYLQKETAKYKLEITDKDGAIHKVSALGLDSITTLPPEPDLSPLLPLLDRLPREILERPHGEVDILLGLGSSTLHGRTVCEWDYLRLLESKFGCGWVLRGCHPSFKFPPTALCPVMSAEARALTQTSSELPERCSVFHIVSGLSHNVKFSELNELGTTPAPVCTKQRSIFIIN